MLLHQNGTELYIDDGLKNFICMFWKSWYKSAVP